MPSFNQLNDFYLASGTAQLLNSWVDPVYKFDSSSFYNWEQDNLPIYDLEDRTNLTYEMAGWPTSAVDGVMLTVSSTGVDNKKVFSTIADAVDALPNTIRCPIIIEVCTSGQLGGMHLEHKNFEGSGAGLEIINRGFAKSLCGSGATGSLVSSVVASGNNGNTGAVAANASAITGFTSITLSAAMTESSSIGVSTPVWDSQKTSLSAISWWNYFSRAFVLYPEWGNAGLISNRSITISTNFGDANSTDGFILQRSTLAAPYDNSFKTSIYEDNSVSSDIYITNPGTGAVAQRPNGLFDVIDTLPTARATGLVYANCLSGVTVRNCSGKIYIRGFCVDGASQADITSNGTQRTDIGFDIQGSEVLLENCAATRCKDAGVEAHNSNVTLNRGFIAHHNYELEGGGAYLSEKVMTNPTAGLRAINSNITLSAATENLYGLPVDSPYCFYRNMKGIVLRNSNLITPETFRYGTNAAGVTSPNSNGSQSLALQTFFNMEEGILAKDSLIKIGQRVSSFQNKIGMSLNNSICEVAEVSIDNNQDNGLEAVNSTFNYNKDATMKWTQGPWYPFTNFTNNGQHIVLNSSQCIPTDVDDMPSNYGRFSLSGNHATITKTSTDGVTSQQTLPAVVVDNGSYMKAVSTKSILHTADANSNAYQLTYGSMKGSAFRVVNSSRLDLYGTGSDNSWVIGPMNWHKQHYNAALYAGQDSHILIAGPTTICQFGIDALAEDSSTVELGPHEKDGLIDVSGYALNSAASPSNQTQVNLHATRACLVANKNSLLNMHDMGDYTSKWDSKYFSDLQDYTTGAAGQNPMNVSSFCTSGWLQFYPNPFVSYTTYGGLVSQSNWPTQASIPTVTATTTRGAAQLTFPLTSATVSALSWGGMCVRGVGDSQVKVRNVTFPAGWANPSGPYYDLSTAGQCDLLRIWNIADNSELHASYLSVGNEVATAGAKFPQDVSGYYYGPSAMWTSGAGATLTPISGAPSSTPDTSTLSVLDTFGKGVATGGQLGTYGQTNFENIGPFRIYVSPHPKN